jgi:hypothetical protein
VSYEAGVTFGKSITGKMVALTNPVVKAAVEALPKGDTKALRNGFWRSG